MPSEASAERPDPYTYSPYAMNGWAPTGGTPQAQEQAEFVTRFIDIYENSFQH